MSNLPSELSSKRNNGQANSQRRNHSSCTSTLKPCLGKASSSRAPAVKCRAETNACRTTAGVTSLSDRKSLPRKMPCTSRRSSSLFNSGTASPSPFKRTCADSVPGNSSAARSATFCRQRILRACGADTPASSRTVRKNSPMLMASKSIFGLRCSGMTFCSTSLTTPRSRSVSSTSGALAPARPLAPPARTSRTSRTSSAIPSASEDEEEPFGILLSSSASSTQVASAPTTLP